MGKYVRKSRRALAVVEVSTAAAVAPAESTKKRRKTPLSASFAHFRGQRTVVTAASSPSSTSDEKGNEGFQRSTSYFESSNGRRENAPCREARRKAGDSKSPSSSWPAAEEATNAMEAEIEKFFQAAEREQALRFADKYNYDVIGDVPLDGRFEWAGIDL